jgi:hypothetical protein
MLARHTRHPSSHPHQGLCTVWPSAPCTSTFRPSHHTHTPLTHRPPIPNSHTHTHPTHTCTTYTQLSHVYTRAHSHTYMLTHSLYTLTCTRPLTDPHTQLCHVFAHLYTLMLTLTLSSIPSKTSPTHLKEDPLSCAPKTPHESSVSCLPPPAVRKLRAGTVSTASAGVAC